MPSNQTRRENYQFYRSIGYSAKQASAMRNRSPARVSTEYRAAINEQRGAREFDGKTIPDKLPDIHRPNMSNDDIDVFDYIDNYRNIGFPEKYFDEIRENTDPIGFEVYNDRFAGLKANIEAQGKDWNEVLDDLDYLNDFGDFMDALGDMYKED